MSAPAHEVATAQPQPDAIAIKVNNVSKVYGLWSSPKARLAHPLLNLAAQMLPLPRIRRSVEHRTRHMFREFHALQDISLEIKKGESWGFIGVNGSGKSTLLKIISGNLRPSFGSVEVDGKVAILDYGAGFNGEFTGRENVYLKASILGLTRRQVDERFGSIVEFADIGQFIDQPVKTYSSGMQARLGFAVMAHVDADIMITDEALAVGDAFFVQKCMAHIRAFLKKGTFLFVTHAVNDVMALCQKAVWLERGQIRKIGNSKEVVEAYLSSTSLKISKQFLDQNASPPIEDATIVPAVVASNLIEIRQPELSARTNSRPPKITEDQRLKYLNRSPWRNDLQIPVFPTDATSVGLGGARIENVTFEDENNAALSWIVGAELVRLIIRVRAEQSISSPIVGFQVKDRLGQVLFADNTYLVTVECPFVVLAGQQFDAEFCFQMPLLPVGSYMIRVAIVQGAENNNAMMHSIENALAFQSITSGTRHGLVGVPMQHIRLQIIDA